MVAFWERRSRSDAAVLERAEADDDLEAHASDLGPEVHHTGVTQPIRIVAPRAFSVANSDAQHVARREALVHDLRGQPEPRQHVAPATPATTTRASNQIVRERPATHASPQPTTPSGFVEHHPPGGASDHVADRTMDRTKARLKETGGRIKESAAPVAEHTASTITSQIRAIRSSRRLATALDVLAGMVDSIFFLVLGSTLGVLIAADGIVLTNPEGIIGASARAFGVASTVLFSAQLMLLAKCPTLDRMYGRTRQRDWYRIIATVSIATTLGHAFGALGVRVISKFIGPARTLTYVFTEITILAALVGTIALVAAIVRTRNTSHTYTSKAWQYLPWWTFLGVVATVPHQLGGPDFETHPVARAYLIVLIFLPIAVFVVHRGLTPLRSFTRYQLHVEHVASPRPKLANIYLAGAHVDELLGYQHGVFHMRFFIKGAWKQTFPARITRTKKPHVVRATITLGENTSVSAEDLFLIGTPVAFTWPTHDRDVNYPSQNVPLIDLTESASPQQVHSVDEEHVRREVPVKQRSTPPDPPASANAQQPISQLPPMRPHGVPAPASGQKALFVCDVSGASRIAPLLRNHPPTLSDIDVVFLLTNAEHRKMAADFGAFVRSLGATFHVTMGTFAESPTQQGPLSAPHIVSLIGDPSDRQVFVSADRRAARQLSHALRSLRIDASQFHYAPPAVA